FNVRDAVVRRLLQRPATQRLYYRIIDEYMNGYWSPEIAAPWLDAMQRTVGLGAQARSFIASTRAAVSRAIERFLDAKLEITTNGGADFTVEGDIDSIELEGEASVRVTSFLFDDGSGLSPFEPTFDRSNRPTAWRATFRLDQPVNTFAIYGSDADGRIEGPASITISRGTSFLRGDADGSAVLSVTDAVTILGYLFRSEPLVCEDAADLDDDGEIGIPDAIHLLEWLFRAGTPPASPFPAPGPDPSADSLVCGS